MGSMSFLLTYRNYTLVVYITFYTGVHVSMSDGCGTDCVLSGSSMVSAEKVN